MNHMCFCNSKTLLRGIRPNPALSQHRPVVVHVNYHQNKQAHMVDIHARYHKGAAAPLLARRKPSSPFPTPPDPESTGPSPGVEIHWSALQLKTRVRSLSFRRTHCLRRNGRA